VRSFVSAHVPPNHLELFDGLIESISLLNWLISEHEVKLFPNGIHGQNFILAVLLYRHVANAAGIW